MTISLQYWLMKSEPSVYAIDDLMREGQTPWEGVRNYQARNFMRDKMCVGDLALFYHSNTNPPGVVGIGQICKAAYPDPTAWDPKSPYFDPKSTPDTPRWLRVDMAFVEKFPGMVTLPNLKANSKLAGMLVIQRGQRLSIQPVEPEHFLEVCAMGRQLA